MATKKKPEDQSDWQTLLRRLRPRSASQGDQLLRKLASFSFAPDIFWYPGSGADLTPLLLDVPDNPLCRRLLRIDQKSQGRPFLLWMNDYSKSLENYPDSCVRDDDMVSDYRNLWHEYCSTATYTGKLERYSFDEEIRISLFTVVVKNKEQGVHQRKMTGDEYLVCFSNCDSEILLERLFAHYQIHLSVIALIRQGGFSGQKIGFDQYIDLPERVIDYRHKLGLAEFWVIDRYGQDDKRRPAADSLKGYSYEGGPLCWGWPPARLFASGPTSYTRTTRPYRHGRSWLS